MSNSWQSLGDSADVHVVRHPGAVTISFRADIDAHNQPRMLAFCRSVLGSSDRLVHLILDFSAVTYFDSSGLRGLEQICEQVRRQGGTFRIVAPPGTITRRLLDIVATMSPLADAIDDGPAPPANALVSGAA